MAAEEQLLPRLRAAAKAVAAGREAIGERIDALERRMLEDEDAGDVTEELRECSQREYAIQAELRSAAESVTEAEVKLAHLEERRDEVLAELQRIGARLGVDSVRRPRRSARTTAPRWSASSNAWRGAASSSGR